MYFYSLKEGSYKQPASVITYKKNYMLREGDKAPFFSGIDQHGNKISLSDYKGKKVILYFYPKDDTPTCTDEANNLQKNISTLNENGFIVVGVSADNEISHKRFSKRLGLSFSLLSDTGKKIIKDYGVWGSRTLFGINYEGILRTTFIIDGTGNIEKIFTKINAQNHARQIIGALVNKIQIHTHFIVLLFL
jgi:thioredoxin-dependent peroxiredoxin